MCRAECFGLDSIHISWRFVMAGDSLSFPIHCSIFELHSCGIKLSKEPSQLSLSVDDSYSNRTLDMRSSFMTSLLLPIPSTIEALGVGKSMDRLQSFPLTISMIVTQNNRSLQRIVSLVVNTASPIHTYN